MKEDQSKNARSTPGSLGPDMAVYGDRLKQMQEIERLRKDSHQTRSKPVSELSQAEKEERLRKMQASAMALKEERHDRSGYSAA